jgi:hypothetical protein
VRYVVCGRRKSLETTLSSGVALIEREGKDRVEMSSNNRMRSESFTESSVIRDDVKPRRWADPLKDGASCEQK